MRSGILCIHDGLGAKIMRDAREAASYGMSSTGKFLTDTGISVGQSAANLAASGGNPVVAAALSQAAAGKAKELSRPWYQLVRSALYSERRKIATESFSIGSILDAVKVGGKNVAVQILKQSGVEASEEGVIVLNFLTNKRPQARFSSDEFALSCRWWLIWRLYGWIRRVGLSSPEYHLRDRRAAQVQSAGDSVDVTPGTNGDIVTMENGKGKTETVKVNQDRLGL